MPTMPPPTITTSPLVMLEVLSSCEWRRSCQSVRSTSTHGGWSRRVDEILGRPAVQVVLGHARLRELLPAVVLSRRQRAEERVAADLLVAARVVDLIELVAAAELAADGVPEELHQLDALDGVDAARAAQVRVEVLLEIG